MPLFILDPALLKSPYVGSKRLAFLYGGLCALDAELRARGSGLIVRRGDPGVVLAQLREETSASGIYAQADVSPYARQRDRIVAAHLPLHLVGDMTVYSPDAVLKDDGDPYVVYTPYKRKWRSLLQPNSDELLPAPSFIPSLKGLASESLPETARHMAQAPFPPGSGEASRRLAAFSASPIYHYADYRDRMDLDATSRLSPYLRFGMLSARQAIVAAHAAIDASGDDVGRKSANTWLDELIWREFYATILYHFPEVRRTSFRESYRNLAWDNDPDTFAAWQEGQTGYPIVDAGMRQLNALGWMHNRARMIVAAFLTKDLLVDWRWGEMHFMQHLVDGDPAANNGGWQWAAGTGTDAAPYFRIFNPVLQGQKYDPDGAYVRRWVPELTSVPDRHIHNPWTMPAAQQERVGCVVGRDYPKPIVDHRLARERALAMYRQV